MTHCRIGLDQITSRTPLSLYCRAGSSSGPALISAPTDCGKRRFVLFDGDIPITEQSKRYVMSPRVLALTVNQNTSCYTELMLRSLIECDANILASTTLKVLDNGSTDDSFLSLKALAMRERWEIINTGLGTDVAAEKHSIAITRMIEGYHAFDYFLLLDCDIWFTEHTTIETMISELVSAGDNCFANQARIVAWRENLTIEGIGGVPGLTPYGDVSWQTRVDNKEYRTILAKRCSPVCCLIRKSEVFRSVFSEFGLHCAHIYQSATEARFFDTLALVTAIMKTHQQSFIVSRKSVMHFGGVLSHGEHQQAKLLECQRMLTEFQSAKSLCS